MFSILTLDARFGRNIRLVLFYILDLKWLVVLKPYGRSLLDFSSDASDRIQYVFMENIKSLTA